LVPGVGKCFTMHTAFTESPIVIRVMKFGGYSVWFMWLGEGDNTYRIFMV